MSVTSEGGKIPESDPVPRPFTVKLDDPAGNSWIEFIGSTADPKWNLRTYNRTREQNVALGLAEPDEEANEDHLHRREDLPAEAIEALKKAHAHAASLKTGATDDDDVPMLENEEIYVFPGFCSSCSAPLDTMMKRVTIPYFKVCRLLYLWKKVFDASGTRKSLSCRRTAITAVIVTTRSNLEGLSLRRGGR